MSDFSATERTNLSWQRTALALVIAAGIITRLTIDTLGPLAIVGGTVACVAAGTILIASRVADVTERWGGIPHLIVCGVVTAVAALELAALIGGL